MILLTTTAYIHENNAKAPQYKQPAISIESQKFGTIKKILWTNKYMHDFNSLIILSAKSTEQGAISYLYNLNISTGKSELLAEFPSHKTLNNVVLFDIPSGQNNIIAAYDKGIIKVNYSTNNNGAADAQRIEIAGFDTATSMDYKHRLIYTRENDKLLYEKSIPNENFVTFFTNNNLEGITAHYTKPLYVANLNSMDNIITYATVSNNRIDLLAMKKGVPIDTPIIKDVVSAKGIEDTYGFTGMNILNGPGNDKKLNLFMIRRSTDKYNNDDCYSLDKIPYNTDPFGAVPSVDSTTYNSEFSIAYTSYDENHKGTLKICYLKQKPKTIVSSENIFGPISMNESYILYFTMEKNNVKIKICDKNGNSVKDISDMIIKK
jgi:hypothetical protein